MYTASILQKNVFERPRKTIVTRILIIGLINIKPINQVDIRDL